MERRRRLRQTGRYIPAALAVLFSPQLAVWGGLLSILRGRGWGFALVTLSVLGNLLFLVVVILAYIIGSDSGAGECSDAVKGAFPLGMRCRTPGPLYFGEFSPGVIPDSVLPPAIYVVLDGCILAGFEFDDELETVKDSKLYDDTCRCRAHLTLATGAFSYTKYGEDSETEYSVRDKDGDGIPDVMVDWVRGEGFERREPIVWHPLKKDK